MLIEQQQNWHDHTRFLIADRFGSVQLETYAEKQAFGGTAFIYALWVEPADRHKGCAYILLNRAERIAAEHNHSTVILEWYKVDTPVYVLEWYKRCGYKEIDRDESGEYVLLEKQLKNVQQNIFG